MSATKSEPQKIISAAEAHLRKADSVLSCLIQQHGPCRIFEPVNHSLFHNLASAIIAQQLSVKAADTIRKRVMKLVSKPLTPRAYLSADQDALRAAGLSKSKMLYIGNLAEAVEAGLSKRKLMGMTDADVINSLTAIKGIGVWTAEMYLIFGLKRLDILSLGDAGLQRAARKLYNDGQSKADLLELVSEKWEPYCSVASWYLWKSLENK